MEFILSLCYRIVIFILLICDVRQLLLYCLILSITLVSAKSPEWHRGVVVMANDKVRTGEIFLQANNDLVLFRQGDTVSVFPAHKIKSLYYYDAERNIKHKFISVSEVHITHRAYHLYEIVLQGELSIWRKQTSPTGNSDKFDFNYFVYYNDELIPLQNFRVRVYPELLKTSHDAMLSFISKENLDPNQPAHAIQIVEFYNKNIRQSIVAANY